MILLIITTKLAGFEMSVQIACEALRCQRRLELRYDGFTRVVEVHAVGLSKDGNDIMRVWQVKGGSSGSNSTGWKLLRVREASALRILDEPSDAPRDQYRRGDRAMAKIFCEV